MDICWVRIVIESDVSSNCGELSLMSVTVIEMIPVEYLGGFPEIFT